MDDFEEKLNSILASPETMGQIMALADSITNQSEQTASEHPSAPVSAPAPAAAKSPGYAAEPGPSHAEEHRHALSGVQPV